jgi:hypothetical protein
MWRPSRPGRLDWVQHSDVSFRDLQTRKVVDTDGIRVGTITDVRFDERGGTWFVLGGGVVEQIFQKLHIRPRIDLLFSPEWIESIGPDEIVLARSAFQLESTCQECWEREKDHLVAAATADHPDRYASLRLTYPGLI